MEELAEFLNGRTSDADARTELKELSREEFVAVFTELMTRIEGQKPYLRRSTQRQGSKEKITIPSGYSSSPAYFAECTVDFSFGWDTGRLVDQCIELRTYRDQLDNYVAKRIGASSIESDAGLAEWHKQNMGESLPWEVGVDRDRARRIFSSGSSYEYTLWLVANRWLMNSGTDLTGPEADALKKAVDREYRSQHGKGPPKVIRGWWRADDQAPRRRSGEPSRAIRLKPPDE